MKIDERITDWLSNPSIQCQKNYKRWQSLSYSLYVEVNKSESICSYEITGILLLQLHEGRQMLIGHEKSSVSGGGEKFDLTIECIWIANMAETPGQQMVLSQSVVFERVRFCMRSVLTDVVWSPPYMNFWEQQARKRPDSLTCRICVVCGIDLLRWNAVRWIVVSKILLKSI